jgi:hypothetical protein
MIVRLFNNCQVYSLDELPKYLQDAGYTSETELYATLGKEYRVFGIAGWYDISYYCIVNDLDMPDWIPSNFFEIIDKRVPPDWVLTEIDDEFKFLHGSPVILRDEADYNDLVQHEPNAVHRFREYVNIERSHSST